jgi:RNA polymerase sigma-70 factor (ECF subfamily)
MSISLTGESLLSEAFAVFAMAEGKTPGDPLEARVIERAREGDGDAFDTLVVRWSRRVTSLAWTVTGNRDVAEEIAQETFVRAWETLGRFRPGLPFGPWLLRIATNLAIDHLRHVKRFDTFDSAPDLVADRIESPEVQAESSESVARIARAIAELPEMQRIIAQLFLVEEYDHAEIAAMTGLTQGTVRSHLSIARAKLRDALSREERSS